MDIKRYSYGMDGGQKYLEEKILASVQPNMSGTMAEIREELERGFESLDCFMMPPPGIFEVQDPDFCGCLKDIDDRKGFIGSLKVFCDTIANPANLILKKNITGRELMNLLIANFDALEKNGGKLLSQDEYQQLKQDIAVSEWFYKSAVKFGTKLDEALQSGFMPPETFEKDRKRIWEETSDEFRKEIRFLSADSIKCQVERLQKFIALRHVERCKMANSIAKLKERSVAENALFVAIVYDIGIKQGMIGTKPNEWEKRLNDHHKVRETEAKKAYNQRSDEREFKEGSEMLSASINCTKELMKLEGPIERDMVNYKQNKLILESIEEYARDWQRQRVSANRVIFMPIVARNKALEHFDRHASTGHVESRKRLIELVDALSEQVKLGVTADSAVERNERITKMKAEMHLFEHKKEVLEEIKQYAEYTRATFHESNFEEILKRKRNRYEKKIRELANNLKCCEEDESAATKELMNMVDKAFSALKQRDDSLKPFGLRLLKLDVKIRTLFFLQMLGEKLDGSYALPEVLDDLFRCAMGNLLPHADPEDQYLEKHRCAVEKSLKEQKKKLKVWNEENKSTFKRITAKFAGGFGVFGAGAAGGGAATLYFAEIAIITTVGAAVATGVGAASLGGIAIAGLSVLAYNILRKKARNKHISEEIKQIEESEVADVKKE